MLAKTGALMTLIARYWLLALGLAVLTTMLFFALTDAAWRLAGSPDGDYPELFFVGLGVPSGFVCLAAGLMWVRVHERWKNRQTRSLGFFLALLAMGLGLFLPARGIWLILRSIP